MTSSTLFSPQSHRPHRPTTAPAAPFAGRSVQPDAAPRHQACWLVAAAALAIFAAPSNLQIPAAVWLCWTLLLAWSRGTRRWWTSALGASAVSIIGTVWMLWSGQIADGTVLLLALAYVPLDVLPVLADRLAAQGLGPWRALVVFALFRVGAEWAFSSLNPLGAAAGVLGNSQTGWTALVQIAAVTGAGGVTFVIGMVASGLAGVLCAASCGSLRRAVASVAVLVGLVAFGQARLAASALSPAPTVRVAGISPDAELERRANDAPTLEAGFAVAGPMNDSVIAATRREAAAGAKIVVWSEGATWATPDTLPGLVQQVATIARQYGVYVDMGVGIGTVADGATNNQSILVRPDGSVAWRYDKAHPIPGMNPYPAGDGVTPVIDSTVGRLATAICFDMDFPATIRQAGRGRADILLVPYSDWYGIKAFHQQGAVMRAVENGVSVVRQADQGVAMVIDPQGRVLTSVDSQSVPQQVLVAQVPTRRASVLFPWMRDSFSALCSLVGLALVAGAWRRGTVSG